MCVIKDDYNGYPVPMGVAGSPCLRWSQIRRPGPPGWGLDVELTAHPVKILLSGNEKKKYPAALTRKEGCGA
jgi:hypothetical protein